MAKKEMNTDTPRVVRTAPKHKKRNKKPLSPGMKVLKGVLSAVGKVFATTFLVLVITGCIVGTALTIYVMEFIDSEATINLNDLDMSYTAVIYAKDSNGNDVEVQSLNQKENRIWAKYSQIPQDLKDAVVYTEDERFMEHYGVDWKRTIAAFVKMAIGQKGYGGSTISQQLVKNINGDISKASRTIPVKIQEIVTAMNLERHYSKPQILECYLNYIALDNNINGVQAGAKYYFNKDVSELTLDECAALAVISQNPSFNNPIKNPEQNQKRRRYAYDKMLEFGAITQEEYDSVYNKELVLAKKNTVSDSETSTKKYQSWYIDSMIEEVIVDLCAKYNWSADHASQLLFTAGYSIYTPMDIEIQNYLEEFFANEDNFKLEGVEYKNELPDAYMNIIDYEGNVVATVGGKGKKQGDRLRNNAMVAKRPAGSTIKPLAVYTPAFEHDIINWSSLMEDSAVQNKENDPEGELDWPKNYDDKYEGNVTIIDALRVSKNTIPVRLVNALTPQVCFDYAYNKMKLQSLVPTGPYNSINPASLALGDAGSTLMELTAAYQTFGNGGYYIAPKLYTKVVDADGKVLLDNSVRSRTQVMSPQTAYIMNKGLWHVVNDGGSGSSAKMTDWEVVGKTGTSNERQDLLFVGLTPYYVAGIRYGYANNDVIPEGERKMGISQIKIWKQIMAHIHEGLNPAKFELNAEGVEQYEYCTVSGGLAHMGCPTKKMGYYKLDGYVPSTCIVHSLTGEVLIDPNAPTDEEAVEGESSTPSAIIP